MLCRGAYQPSPALERFQTSFNSSIDIRCGRRLGRGGRESSSFLAFGGPPSKMSCGDTTLTTPHLYSLLQCRTGVLWVCMAYDVITVSALGCRIIDDEVSTQYTRACAHSGLILVGHDYLPLLLVLAAFQLGLAILWMLAGRDARDGQMSSAQVYPAVILKQAPFRQELSRYRGHGMSQLQDLVSGDSASDGVPHILSLLMFDLLFVPSVYAGSAAFVCTDDDYLAVICLCKARTASCAHVWRSAC